MYEYLYEIYICINVTCVAIVKMAMYDVDEHGTQKNAITSRYR
jgi:hypothetical protein